MDTLKEHLNWVEFDMELFMYTPEFYLVLTFLVIMALGFAGTYLLTDQEDE